MFKRVLLAVAVAAAVSAPAFAEVSISGSAEMDLFIRTNQAVSESTDLSEEIAIVINVDGKDKLDNGDTLKWRLAQKVATDYRYDAWGKREAWIGYQGGWGELRFGNQFTNSYLTLDWPYGSKGQGNMSSDWGAMTDRWGDAISYFSPEFGGFNITAQYKIGDNGKDTLTNGYDIGLNGTIGPVTLNAGYQKHEDAVVGMFPVGSSGTGTITLPAFVKDASTQMYFVGGRAAFGDFSFKALWKGNEWKGSGNKLTADQYLLGGSYSMGKHVFSLGWQEILESKLNGQDSGAGTQQVSGQWDYSVSKNTGAFLQARYHMYDKDAQLNKFDGSAKSWLGAAGQTDTSNTLRVLVGTWTGF